MSNKGTKGAPFKLSNAYVYIETSKFHNNNIHSEILLFFFFFFYQLLKLASICQLNLGLALALGFEGILLRHERVFEFVCSLLFIRKYFF